MNRAKAIHLIYFYNKHTTSEYEEAVIKVIELASPNELRKLKTIYGDLVSVITDIKRTNRDEILAEEGLSL